MKASTPQLDKELPKLAEEIDDDDLTFIRDLMEGAEKVVIYRKNIKVTVEFN